MSELDDIYLNTVYAHPPKGMLFGIDLANDYVYQSLKSQIKSLMLDNDPDFGRDIQAFYTDSIYVDLSDSERDLLVKDRIDEHNQIIEKL